MKNKYVFFLLVSLVMVVSARAQKACVIANAEDHTPLREALIHTNNNHWARTDYRGYWTMKYAFDSATVSKPGFLKTTIYLKTLPDTVFLLPQSHQLATVEVWGENTPGINNIKKQAKTEAEMAGGPSRGFSFDLANMFDARGRRDRKHLKKAKELTAAMQQTKDPIIDAYEKATGHKYGVLLSDTAVQNHLVPLDSTFVSTFDTLNIGSSSSTLPLRKEDEKMVTTDVKSADNDRERKGERLDEEIPAGEAIPRKDVRVSVEQQVGIRK